MEWYITGLLIIVGFLMLLAVGMPVAAAMGAVAFVGMLLGPGLEKGLVAGGTELGVMTQPVVPANDESVVALPPRHGSTQRRKRRPSAPGVNSAAFRRSFEHLVQGL